MSRCVITREKTSNKTNGIPLSREGRELLSEIHNRYNQLLKDTYLAALKEKGDNKLPEHVIERLAPHVNKSNILRELAKTPTFKDLDKIRNQVLEGEDEVLSEESEDITEE